MGLLGLGRLDPGSGPGNSMVLGLEIQGREGGSQTRAAGSLSQAREFNIKRMLGIHINRKCSNLCNTFFSRRFSILSDSCWSI